MGYVPSSLSRLVLYLLYRRLAFSMTSHLYHHSIYPMLYISKLLYGTLFNIFYAIVQKFIILLFAPVRGHVSFCMHRLFRQQHLMTCRPSLSRIAGVLENSNGHTAAVLISICEDWSMHLLGCVEALHACSM